MTAKALACVTGCICACFLFSTGAQADEIPANTAVFDIEAGAEANALNVSYIVADNSDLDAYTHPVTTINTETITPTGVSFNASSDIVIPNSSSPVEMMAVSNSFEGLSFLSTDQISVSLSSESIPAPAMPQTRGNPIGPVGPLASASSQVIPVSAPGSEIAAPEPATNLLLLVGLLLLPLRDHLVKACRLIPVKQNRK